MNNEIVAEIQAFGKWEKLTVEEALARRKRVMRCPECHGRVRPHDTGSNGQAAHMEHYDGHPGCSRGHYFDGVARLHHKPLR